MVARPPSCPRRLAGRAPSRWPCWGSASPRPRRSTGAPSTRALPTIGWSPRRTGPPTGLLPGGRHEGLGTHNRIVPLGGGYLELMAVLDPEAAASSELAAALQAGVAREAEGLLAWSIAVDDVEPVAARLGTSITTVKREGL